MVYITGDTHGDIQDFIVRMGVLNPAKGDIVIICGDFGFDWDETHISQWNQLERPYTVLFCDGNHENYDVLNNLKVEKMFGDEVGVFADNTYRLLTGHIYDIEGIKTFVFGGASSIDKDWRIENEVAYGGKLWWKEEVPSPEVFELAKETLRKHGWTFDLFLSHTCRPELKAEVLSTYKADFHDPVEDMIRALEEEIKLNGGGWKRSCFGHFHTDVAYGRYMCLYRGALKWKKVSSSRAGKGKAVSRSSELYYEKQKALKAIKDLLHRAEKEKGGTD